MFAIIGATGHSGKRIVQNLLRAGHRVRAIGRSQQRLGDLGAAGADICTGDATDAAFLTDTFRGADAVYTLVAADTRAPDYRAAQDAHGEAIARAVADSGVRCVVFLSSLGAEMASGNGPIAGLHAQEQRLGRLDNVNVLILRPGYFFENFEETLGLIKHQGINGGAIAGDARIPMIATRDIADAAAAALQQRDWHGVVVRELLGPRDMTHAEATRIIGEHIGRPDLPYVQFPYADYTAALVQAGLSPSAAEVFTDLARALNAGVIESREGRTSSNTTTTRFEDFARELAAGYQAI